jgi:hypothetical protein
MKKRNYVGLVIVALVLIVTGQVAAQTTLRGDRTEPPNAGSPGDPGEATEVLFVGDFGPEIGIGCSNGGGTSGGPNDVFVGVNATLTPPFGITSHTYNIFTQVSPTITALTFQTRAGGGSPGAVGYSQAGLPFTQGNHTVAVPDPFAAVINSSQFYFGQTQPQTNVGMRWGVDTSSGSQGTSFLRAPTCGASSFVTLDSIGFPGNWVMAVIVDDTIPVELMNFTID